MNWSTFHIYLKHEINMNEHQNVFYFNHGKMSIQTIVKSIDVNLLSCLICLLDKMADSALRLVRLSVYQGLCEGSVALIPVACP